MTAAQDKTKTERAQRWSARSGYSKGNETRQAILAAALKAFGAAEYPSVSTREIARLAGVNQPAINYYFRSKEGLYRACARAIVEEFFRHTLEPAARATQSLEEGADPETLRQDLTRVILALTDLMVASDDLSPASAFLDRELHSPGPAHKIVYDELWLPGITLVARLIAGIRGSAKVGAEDRAEAILLLSSLVGFSSGRSVTLSAMEWKSIGKREAALLHDVLRKQIAAIG